MLSFLSGPSASAAAPAVPSAAASLASKPQQQRVNDFAEELKKALLSVGRDKSGQVIGVQLGDSANFRNQVDALVQDIKSSYSAYSSEIGKAQKIKELNNKLTTNFRQNLQVMIDVTKLLASYVQLFDVIKEELKKINSLIGKDVSLDDISYLEKITQQQIEQLQAEFTRQTEVLGSLYTQNNLEKEREHIDSAKQQMGQIVTDATSLVGQYGNQRPLLQRSVSASFNGGRKTKKNAGKK